MSYSTDIEFVSRLCCKDATESDWRRFYESYQTLIRTWCHRAGVPPSEMNDVFHDILVKLVSNLSNYQHQNGHRFRGWLKTVMMNAVTDRLRVSKDYPFPQLLSGSELTQQLVTPAEIEGIAEELTEKTSSAAMILARVRERVQETTWNAFVQRELLQIEAVFIAEELGIKKASVYQSCSRVRAIIAEESEKYFRQNET